MDLMKMVWQMATPVVLNKVAGLLGVSGETAQKGLSAAVPAVLAALLGKSQQPGGTDLLGSLLSRAGDGSALANDPTAAASQGSDLLGSLLGGDTLGKVAGALASYAGVPKAGAGSLLGLAGSLALGGLNSATGGKGAAGAVSLLQSNSDQINAAIPGDFAKALAAAGIPGTAAVTPPQPAPQPAPAPKPAPKPAAAPRPAPPPPPPQKSSWTRWLMWLLPLLILLWLLTKWMSPAPEPVAPPPPPEPAPAAAPAPAPAPEPAPEPTMAPAPEPAAPTEAAAPAENPLVVGGVDIGAQVTGALDKLRTTFGGITDTASAEAALPDLTAARDTLSGLDTQVAALPETGKSALKSLVAAALPAIETSANGLLANSAVAGTVKPVVDDIIARLKAFAA